MISAVILTHNDEKIIQRAIQSVSWCDEVIVVDDESSDKTRESAKKMGAVIYIHPLNDNFADQRNEGLSKAKGDWILFLDSDEEVSLELQKEIQQGILRDDIDGYLLKRQDWLFGKQLKYGETATVSLLRLARKEKGEWQRSVHEVWNIRGTTSTLSSPLFHYPHPTMAEFIDDINRYSTLHAVALKKEGKQSNLFEIIAYPIGKFLQNYIIRQGFRDGTPGAILAIMMSFHSFLAKGKLYLTH